MKKSQQNVLPHSQAKLDLYQAYLEKYFAILGLAKGIEKVNIYDLFCGTGIYEDGKEGSPIIAFNKICKNREFFKQNNWPVKPISLLVNDSDPTKINIVKAYLEAKNNPSVCDLQFHSSNTTQLFPEIVAEINKQSKKERNLLFIDPYGYKEISPKSIKDLLENGRTEIILFLPVSFMHRFKNISLVEERKCYQALNDFIVQLFPENHAIRNLEKVDVETFTRYLSEGLSFQEKYFCVSHQIERSKNNLFAVFFITSHIYGLERMLTVKWENDKDFGTGYRQPQPQISMFEQEEKKDIESLNYVWLSRNLHDLIEERKVISNLDLYKFTLQKGFLPKHSNSILKNWVSEKAIMVLNAETGEIIVSPRTFHNKWEDYREGKPKIQIKFK